MKTLNIVPIAERSPMLRLSAVRTCLVALSVAVALTNGAFTRAYADYNGLGCTTLRTPLVPGASFAPAGQAAQEGAPPPVGCGDTPWPVTPGMTGTPTYEPWASRIPANQIDQDNSVINMPFTPADAYPPGAVQEMTRGSNVIPGPPTFNGEDPGLLHNSVQYDSATGKSSGPSPGNSSAVIITVPPGGQYPDNAAPVTKRPGQTTSDFGLPTKSEARLARITGSATNDFGQRLEQVVPAKVLAKLQYSQDGATPVYPHINEALETEGVEAPTVTHDYGVPFLIPVAVPNSNKRTPTAPLTTIAPY